MLQLLSDIACDLDIPPLWPQSFVYQLSQICSDEVSPKVRSDYCAFTHIFNTYIQYLPIFKNLPIHRYCSNPVSSTAFGQALLIQWMDICHPSPQNEKHTGCFPCRQSHQSTIPDLHKLLHMILETLFPFGLSVFLYLLKMSLYTGAYRS